MTTEETEPLEKPSPKPRRSRVHTAFTTLLVVGLVAVLGLGGWLWWQDRETDESPAALAQARTASIAFFTLDWTDVEHDIDRMVSLSTGKFKSSYSSQRASLAKGVEDKKLTITSKVPESGTALEYLHGRRRPGPRGGERHHQARRWWHRDDELPHPGPAHPRR